MSPHNSAWPNSASCLENPFFSPGLTSPFLGRRVLGSSKGAMSDSKDLFVRTAGRHGEFDAPDADGDERPDLEQLAANRAAGGIGQVGRLQGHPAQAVQQHISHRGKPQLIAEFTEIETGKRNESFYRLALRGRFERFSQLTNFSRSRPTMWAA